MQEAVLDRVLLWPSEQILKAGSQPCVCCRRGRALNRAVCYRTSLRQLKKPGLLVASYKGDATGMATAAMEEVEKPLVKCLNELERHALAFAGVKSVPRGQLGHFAVLPALTAHQGPTREELEAATCPLLVSGLLQLRACKAL